jgi:alkylation response protein AidB-like acyl-CoA dehydrogenase
MKELGLFGATSHGVRRPGPVRRHLRRHRGAHGLGLDGDVGIFNSHLIMAACVQRTAPRRRSATWLPRFASGELRGGIGLTEPTPAPTCRHPHRAVRDGEHYVINGTKTWITNGLHGGCFGVLVKTDPQASRAQGHEPVPLREGPRLHRHAQAQEARLPRIDSCELQFDRTTACRLTG